MYICVCVNEYISRDILWVRACGSTLSLLSTFNLYLTLSLAPSAQASGGIRTSDLFA